MLEITGAMPSVGDLNPLISRSLDLMESALRRRFAEGSPDWAPLADGSGAIPFRGGASFLATLNREQDAVSGALLMGKGLAYASIQQFGGETHPVVTEKMIKFFWAKWYETKNDRWKAMALAWKEYIGEPMDIEIPPRPMMEWTPELLEQIAAVLGTAVSFEPVRIV